MPYDFSIDLEIEKMLKAAVGSRWENNHFEFLKTVNSIEIREKQRQTQIYKSFFIEKSVNISNFFLTFEACCEDAIGTTPNEIIIDSNLLIEPLLVRNYKSTDTFTPLGMKGKKTVHKFLKDRKVSSFQRENVLILVNGDGAIIWVLNHQIDNRFRITNETTTKLKITIR